MFVLSSTFYFSKKTTHTQEREREKSLLSVSQNHSFVLSPSKNVRFRFFSISPKADSSLRQQKKKKMSANGQKTTSRALCLSVFSEPCCRIGRRFSRGDTHAEVVVVVVVVFDETRRKGTQNIIIFEGRHTKKNISPDVVVQRTHSLKTSLSTSTKRMPTASNPNATRLPTTCIAAGATPSRRPPRQSNQGALQGEHLFLSLRLSLSLFCKRAFSYAECDDE